MGIVGAVIIARWSWGLMRGAGAVLLDMVPDRALPKAVRAQLEAGGDRVADLHLWRVGPGHDALVAAIVSDDPQPPATYEQRLKGLVPRSHVTIEVHRCPAHDDPARPAAAVDRVGAHAP